MKFLAVSTNTRDVSEFLTEEFKRTDELRAAGTITGAWLKSDYTGAVLMLECADEEEAAAALGSLPIAASKAATITLTPVVDMDSVRPDTA